MSTDVTSRPNDLTLCHQIIAEQQSTIGELQRELQQVKHYVERLLRGKYGPHAERVRPESAATVPARRAAPTIGRNMKQWMNPLASFTSIVAAVAVVDIFPLTSLAKLWNTILSTLKGCARAAERRASESAAKRANNWNLCPPF